MDSLSSKHRVLEKNFETEMWINGNKLPLNHFIQETLANVLIGFTKGLKNADSPTTIDVKVKKLGKSSAVDAHTYP